MKWKNRRRQVKHPGRVYVEKNGYGANWWKQRGKALKRDDYKCTKCGSKRGLQVHHIRKIALFYNRNKGELDYESANHLSNLTTLCSRCHRVADGHSKMRGFEYLK